MKDEYLRLAFQIRPGSLSFPTRADRPLPTGSRIGLGGLLLQVLREAWLRFGCCFPNSLLHENLSCERSSQSIAAFGSFNDYQQHLPANPN